MVILQNLISCVFRTINELVRFSGRASERRISLHRSLRRKVPRGPRTDRKEINRNLHARPGDKLKKNLVLTDAPIVSKSLSETVLLLKLVY